VGEVVLAIPHRVPLGPISATVFLVVAVLAAILTDRRPAFAVAALLVLDPFAWAHDLGPTQITIGKAALIGATIALVARRASLHALWNAPARPLVIGALAIVTANALTAIPGVYIDAVARETLKALEYVLAFGTAAIAVSRAEAPDNVAVAGGVLVSTLLACAFALAQEVSGASSGAIVGAHVIARIAGPLDGPNQLAGFLDLTIPFALAYAIDPGRLRDVARIVLAVAVCTDVLTLSRAGVLGAAVGIACILAFRARGLAAMRPLAFGGAAVFAALAGLATTFGFARRFFEFGDVSRENGLGTRSELWRAAIDLWKSDPALGIGAGNYELVLPRVGLIGVRTHANSLYLQSLAEGGIALASATVWTIVCAAILCLRSSKRSATLLAIGAGTVALGTHQIFDDLTFFPKVGEFWWILLGVAVGLSARLDDGRSMA
jgi:O-antigen ligase